jgi:N-acetylmuramoyl-L-alanine amidase
MGARSRILDMSFAGFSPVFGSRGFGARFLRAAAATFSRGSAAMFPRLCAGQLLLLGACAIPFFGVAASAPVAAGAADTTKSNDSRRAAATAQFDRAEEQRSALNEKPANKRTLAEYKNVVTTYRRVFLITPRAPEVPESLSAVGQLYTEMGDRFGRSYYQSAVDSYRFLMREYPASKLSQDAMLKVAALEKDQLGDPRAAAKIYDDFLKKYPKSARRREAQEARAELALTVGSPSKGSDDSSAGGKNARGNAVSAKNGDDSEDDGAETSTGGAAPLPPVTPSGGTPRVRRITTKAMPDETRVTIDLEDAVQYSSARIKNPDRIFFDIHDARLPSEVAKANVAVEGNLVTAVRAAQNHAGIVRVVLDVNGVKEYNASLQDNPPALIIDLYAKTGAAKAANKGVKPVNPPVVDAKGDAELADVLPAGPANVTGKNKDKEIVPTSPAKGVDAADVPGNATAGTDSPATATSAAKRATPSSNSNSTNGSAKATTSASNSSSSDAAGTSNLPPSLVRSDPSSKKLKKGAKPDLIQPASSAQPTRDGQSTLTRALGLKIGRIVIDAGHGGHDSGTLGVDGIEEKDVVLDVALRLGKLLHDRLGSEIIYTRSDDTFIPLETRTAIANKAQADLFLSIHANSSRDESARGVETYYLNFTTSPDALETAARENAVSDQSIHQLSDLVKKIALKDKIAESREFANDVQEGLYGGLQRGNTGLKDRGVKKAPFVVLIGANMPSILAEISFVTNEKDARQLREPEYRERVAESLYKGVSKYAGGLSGARTPTERASGN